MLMLVFVAILVKEWHYRQNRIISFFKHFDTLFYSSEEHFISDNLNKVSKSFKIVKGSPIQSSLQIISPRLRLGDIIL